MERNILVTKISKRILFSKIGYLFIKFSRWSTKRSTIVEIICALFIILFIYTGLNKIIDHESFKFQLGRSPYLQQINGLIATTLPVIELLIALSLILKRTRLTGLYFSFLLMSLFTGYIWIMLNESYYLPCSCGGILAEMSWDDHLIFNSVFTLLSVIGIVMQHLVLKITDTPS